MASRVYCGLKQPSWGLLCATHVMRNTPHLHMQLLCQVGESVSFGEMVEAGKLLEMSVLGLVRHDKAQISLDGRDLVIAPPCDEVLDLHHGDKIVVIADLV
mmetsp:Transcript_5648/g.17176  ORF Transcript_5648/g.17176 Transcript_5648/m.17176 type:complete len:101 (+) Transcript_5648:3568-3870(+)